MTLTYRGPSPGQAKQNLGLRVFFVFFTWEVFCRYSAGIRIVNGLFVDVHFEIFGHSHPCFTEAMTFPSCRGSAYVTAESGVLKFHQQVQRNNSNLDKTYYQVTMDGAWGERSNHVQSMYLYLKPAGFLSAKNGFCAQKFVVKH